MDIYEKKMKALDYFKDRLLSSDAKELIGKIILFGSVGKRRSYS